MLRFLLELGDLMEWLAVGTLLDWCGWCGV